ncbi:MAG: ATP-binding protein [Patescibacteria group bacterium]
MKRFRLRFKFVVLLSFASLAPLAIMGLLTFVRFQSALREDAEKFGSQLTETAAAEVRSFILSQVKVLDTISTLYNPEFPTEQSIVKRIVERTLFKNDNFTDISITDAGGQEIIRENRVLVITQKDLKNIQNTEAFAAVKGSGLYVGPLYIDGGKPFFDIGRSIVDFQGIFLGGVFAQVDAKVMRGVSERVSKIAGLGGRVFIVNENGIVIAHPDLSYILSEKDLSSIPPIKEIISEKNDIVGAQRYSNENNEDVLGSALRIRIDLLDFRAPIPFPINWFVVAEQSADIVFAESFQLAIFSGLMMLLVMAAAVFGAIFFARKISKPVEELHTATKEFAKGNLAYRPKVDSNDELGDLAKSFVAMASTLSESIERIKKEELIASAERNKLSIILSGITDAVIAVDMGRNIILFNKSAETLTGLSEASVIGKPIQEILRIFDQENELLAEIYCPVNPDLPEGVTFSKNNLKYVNSKNQEHYINVIAGTITEGLAIGLGCILTLNDNTREFLLEKTKVEFVSVVAHQLRTPITGIKWAFKAMLEKEFGPISEEQEKVAKGGLETSLHMIDLINDLLDTARIEEGKFGLKPTKQSFSKILESVVEGQRLEAKNKGVEVSMTVPLDLPLMNLDNEKMTIALDNIIDNAIKYTPAKGKVVINVSADSKNVRLDVKDSGIGIPAGKIDRVFTKFFRAPNASHVFTSGSGLGLYIAKNIIESHGGTISVKSVEGLGTTVSVVLPIAK